MDFFHRTTFPSRDPWANQKKPQAHLGCPECEELKKNAKAVGSRIPDSELSCSKCRRKKSFSYAVEQGDRASDIETLGQTTTPAPAPVPEVPLTPTAAPAMKPITMFAVGAGILGLALWAISRPHRG